MLKDLRLRVSEAISRNCPEFKEDDSADFEIPSRVWHVLLEDPEILEVALAADADPNVDIEALARSVEGATRYWRQIRLKAVSARPCALAKQRLLLCFVETCRALIPCLASLHGVAIKLTNEHLASLHNAFWPPSQQHNSSTAFRQALCRARKAVGSLKHNSQAGTSRPPDADMLAASLIALCEELLSNTAPTEPDHKQAIREQVSEVFDYLLKGSAQTDEMKTHRHNDFEPQFAAHLEAWRRFVPYLSRWVQQHSRGSVSSTYSRIELHEFFGFVAATCTNSREIPDSFDSTWRDDPSRGTCRPDGHYYISGWNLREPTWDRDFGPGGLYVRSRDASITFRKGIRSEPSGIVVFHLSRSWVEERRDGPEGQDAESPQPGATISRGVGIALRS